MGVVVSLGDYRLSSKARNRFSNAECQHKQIELNDNGHIVTCMDCHKQVDAYFVLRSFVEDWGQVHDELMRQQLKFEAARTKHLQSEAAKLVEKAWQSADFVPTCPHCHEGITAYDYFGHKSISKLLDDERREARKTKPNPGA